jgi:hypothetical protein
LFAAGHRRNYFRLEVQTFALVINTKHDERKAFAKVHRYVRFNGLTFGGVSFFTETRSIGSARAVMLPFA